MCTSRTAVAFHLIHTHFPRRVQCRHQPAGLKPCRSPYQRLPFFSRSAYCAGRAQTVSLSRSALIRMQCTEVLLQVHGLAREENVSLHMADTLLPYRPHVFIKSLHLAQ